MVISGIATAISLPLTIWIMSLEDQDEADQHLRQNLCSVVVVVIPSLKFRFQEHLLLKDQIYQYDEHNHHHHHH